jgi:hypothetical protein
LRKLLQARKLTALRALQQKFLQRLSGHTAVHKKMRVFPLDILRACDIFKNDMAPSPPYPTPALEAFPP